jgi:hypothetical protein
MVREARTGDLPRSSHYRAHSDSYHLEEKRMIHKTRIMMALVVLALLLLPAAPVSAQEDPIEQALEACKPEIETYCSQVTPGDGRLLACFVAHEDKISGQCGWAVYQAMDAFENFVDALGYLVDTCWDDAIEYCGEVELGEGRVATCLLDNKDNVTPECQEAMEDVELEVVED